VELLRDHITGVILIFVALGSFFCAAWILFYSVLKSRALLKSEARHLQVLAEKNTALEISEKKVRKIAEKWEKTFESIVDLVSIHDKDFKLVNVNKAFAESFNSLPDELIGRHCYSVVHNTSKPVENCPCIQVLETGKPFVTEMYEPTLEQDLEISVSPMFENDVISGYVHIVKNISEIKRIRDIEREKQAADIKEKAMKEHADILESKNLKLNDSRSAMIHMLKSLNETKEKLEESAKYTENIIKNIADMLIVVDPRGIIESINDAVTILLGHKEVDVVGRRFEFCLSDGSWQSKVDLMFKHLVNNKYINEQFLTFKARNNKQIPVNVSGSAMQDNQGNISGFVFIARDMREVKILQEKEKRHAAQIARAEAEKLRSSQLQKEVEERKKAEHQIQIANESLENINSKLEESINNANSLTLEAQQASISKSEFLATMSHEIRTPMNGVLGMANLLLYGNPTPDQKEKLDIIVNSGKALLNIINDILDFSKIESGKLNLEIIDFNLQRFLEEFNEQFLLIAEDKGIKYISFLNPDVPVHLKGDPGRLRQILTNLVGNAFKFTFRGEVSVRCELLSNDEHCAKLKFYVMDTGIGIDKKQQMDIFNPFKQEDGSTTRKFGGTGLGLSISKHLTEIMGGTIGVESTKGEGSEFWFTVEMKEWMNETGFGNGTLDPAAESQDEEPRILTHNEVKEKLNNGSRILIVEDNQINLVVADSILKNFGYRPFLASNGKEAVELMEDNFFDLILMDLQMPVMDGYEATRQIRKLEKSKSGNLSKGLHTPILAMTAHAMDSHQNACMEAGMDDYISKPVDPKNLIKMIEKWIDPDSYKAEGPSSDNEEAPVTDNSVFDKIGVLNRVMNDIKLFEKILQAALTDMPTAVERLIDAVDKEELREIAAMAHFIKGSSKTIGGVKLAKAAREIELALEAGDTQLCKSIGVDLKKYFEQLKRIMQGELAHLNSSKENRIIT